MTGNSVKFKLFSSSKHDLIATCFTIKAGNVTAERAFISILISFGRESEKVLILSSFMKNETNFV